MELLGKLFGSPARIKLLRFFVFNTDNAYDRDELVALARITPATASKELNILSRAGIIKRRSYFKAVTRPGSSVVKKRRTMGWILDQKYPYFDQLTRFLRDTLSVSDEEIRKRFSGMGTLQLLILAGFLIDEKESALDLLLVGDRLDETAIRTSMRAFEAECGQELRYAILSTDEFLYRRHVRDKLIRDVMDYPHRVLVDRLPA